MTHDNKRFARFTGATAIKIIARFFAMMTVIASLFVCGCRVNPFPDGYFAEEIDTAVAFLSSFKTAFKDNAASPAKDSTPWFNLSGEDIPVFDGETPAYILNGNVPVFSDSAITTSPCEIYSPLDRLGRTLSAACCLDAGMMPEGERGDISYPRPSGYVNRRYVFIDNGQYLYNHCHLIGWQLTGQTDKPENLITGTRFLNIEGMLPYENAVASYLRETGNHVLYRVTPVYVENELVARGVEMEALSVEDGGRGIRFHVFCYNVQPGVAIDYTTGENTADGTR